MRATEDPVQLAGVYVVVQVRPCFKFYFPMFWGMVIYDIELEIKENKM